MDGTPFGRYRLIELLGRGGMGEVWRAYDTATRRVVALKLLAANLANDPDYEERFRREAFAAASLNDPHVVPIHNFGEIDGRLYVDMRLIKGSDLQAILSRGRLEPARAVTLIEQVASALSDAHEVSLVHRDVKPSNILVTATDFAYLIDFGIARAVGDSTMTGAGTIIGTWAYVAPERLMGGTIDGRVDTYALACVLHETLTGRQPFPGDSIEQQMSAHLTKPPPRPSALRGDLPPQLDAVIAKGMAKNPDHRFSSVVEMAHAAKEAVTDPIRRRISTPQAPPARLWVDPPPVPPVPTQHLQPSAKKSRRGLGIALAALAVMTIVALVAAIVAQQLFSGDHTRTPTAEAAGPGSFTGIYNVSYGEPTDLQNTANGNRAPGDDRWAVWSTCPDTGCVATAVHAADDEPLVAPEFDLIGGTWVAVGSGNGSCHDEPADYWVAVKLAELPDGDFDGTIETLYPAGCSEKFSVRLSRTGDVDVDEPVLDPAELSPRVSTPAEGLRGEYRNTRTWVGSGSATVTDYRVATYCRRTGESCIGYLHVASSGLPLVFADGVWTADLSWDEPCEQGGTSRVTMRVEYPMPEDPANPIAELIGSGEVTMTGSQCQGGSVDDMFVRIGD